MLDVHDRRIDLSIRRRRLRETILHFASSLDAGLSAIGQPVLRVALTSGGDERLAVDPRSGRNRYGVPPHPVPSEAVFASSTASPISARGLAAAEAALTGLLCGGPRAADQWAEEIRERLLRLYGIPGAEAVLAASGTEAEFVVLALARNLLARSLATIVVAPGETGSGVALAAGGRHFLDTSSLGPVVAKGDVLAGFEAGVTVEGVDIRDPEGAALDATAVDRAVLHRAQAALGADRDLLVHCLDTSKTGLSGFSRSTAAALQASAGGRCLIVVDACQLRCPAETIRRDLAAGFIVVITGSKFAGGPPFSGAVLVPPALVAGLGRIVLPPGLAAYSARNDWPARLRPQIDGDLPTTLNIGLGLRWEAALAELEAFHAIDPTLRTAITTRFGALVAQNTGATAGLEPVPGRDGEATDRGRTIFPIVTAGRDGRPLCARTLHRRLMAPHGADRTAARVFHVGQPVQVGPVAALRVCLGMPHVCDVAGRAATIDLATAMAPLAADLDALFAKWSALREAANGEPVPAQRRA